MTGAGQGIIWVAQGEYVSLCATEDTKGFYYAMYWGLYMMSNILGNAIGAIILNYSSGPPFFITMGCLMLIVAVAQLFIVVPESKHDEVIEHPKTVM